MNRHPGFNDPCPFHMKSVEQRRQGGFPSWHNWGTCAANVFSDRFDTGKCLSVLNRSGDNNLPPRWYVDECKREKGLTRQQPQQGAQYHFGGLAPGIPPSGVPPPPCIAAPGGSYVFQPTVNQQPPPSIPAPGGSYVFQAGQQHQQRVAGGSYMNQPAQAGTVPQQSSQFVYQADGTLG